MSEQLSAALEQHYVADSDFASVGSLDAEHVARPERREHTGAEHADTHAPVPTQHLTHKLLFHCRASGIAARSPGYEQDA
jgi:hypothetical protein